MFLFSLIAIGYFLAKFKLLPKDSATVLSKLENYLFVPALVMGTFISNFTPSRISAAAKPLLTSIIILIVVIPFAILCSRLLIKDRYLQNIYTYGLSFANFGFMGNAVFSALFPDMFFEYLIFTLPLWTMIYLWGVPVLLIADSSAHGIKQKLKAFLNPMMIAMLIGMIIGITGIKLPTFATSLIDSTGACMSPVAMLLTGITVSTISLKKTLKDVSLYVISIIRLIIFPLIFIGVAKLIPIDSVSYTCALCALAMPLGLNTIVIPSAYGKDTKKAAGMAVISHMLSIITIPIIFMFL